MISDVRRASVVDGAVSINRLMAVFVSILLATRINLIYGVTLGYLVSLILIPLWMATAWRHRAFRWLALVGALALVSGLGLTAISAGSHVTVSRTMFVDSLDLLGLVTSIGALLWARTVIPTTTMAAWFGVGMLVEHFLTGSPTAGNPWKQFWGIPVAVILLALCAKSKSALLDVGCLVVLILASALNDSRSYAATFVLALLLRLWQMRPRGVSRGGSATLTGLFLIAVGVATYQLVQSLLLGGALGVAAQQRSQTQIDTSGSLLLGGRPELAATFALMRDHVIGFGVGVLPNWHDSIVVKTGMSSINYNPFNGYVDNFMLGNGFELHSMLGDIWTRWGLLGLLFLLTLLVVVLQALLRQVAMRRCTGVALFLTVWTLWNSTFSPLLSSLSTTIVGVALLLAYSQEAAEDLPVAEPATVPELAASKPAAAVATAGAR